MHIHLVHLHLLLGGRGVVTFLTTKKLQCQCIPFNWPVVWWKTLDSANIFIPKRQNIFLFCFFGSPWPCQLRSGKMTCFYLHLRATLTVPPAGLLLCRFLLRCDFRHRQAPLRIQLLWFVADDGTVFTWQLAASNHSNRKGGKFPGSWAGSQVMSSLPFYNLTFSLLSTKALVNLL